jgi:hypothetical protein
MCEKIKPYIDNPQLLIDLASDVIDELNTITPDNDQINKKIQLIEINKAIRNLESKNISVPEGLRNEKIKLIGEINDKSMISKIQILKNGFDELLRTIGGDEKNDVPKKRKRSKELKTDNSILRCVLIEVLKQMNGCGKVKDIKMAMEKKLISRFLPGDLLLRADGKTIAWFNNVQWERLRMVEEGLLKKDSPNGYWELAGDAV